MLIDIKKTYSGVINFTSDNEIIDCKIEGGIIELNTFITCFKIKIELTELGRFVRTLKEAQKYFKDNNCDQGVMIAIYTVGNDKPVRCMMGSGNCRVEQIPVQEFYPVNIDQEERPWIDKFDCDELIDFIESNFVLYDINKDRRRDILGTIKKIKEIK